MKKYDYLIVGAGLFGSVFAHECTKRGRTCLIIDKRHHIGGNIYCEDIEGINVHKYGAHIFHTSDKDIWRYVNKFTEFNNFVNSPVANYKGELYNLPFNMNTFYQLWKVKTPKEAREIIEKQRREANIEEPNNLEEQAISLVGKDIYIKLIKGYTEKQWGSKARDLPSFIIKRIPIRFTFNNNYFNDTYQGIPIGGYNKIVEKLLVNVDVRLGINYFNEKEELDKIADKIVYTGMIDEFYEYCFGELQYRSLNFETEILNMDNFQGSAVVNYTEYEIPFTRVIEHKHFEFGNQEKTVITREYPLSWKKGKEPYYPVNDLKNNELYQKYRNLADKENKVIFGGRLAEYKYYDMDTIIKRALDEIKKEFKEN